jgi:hypothetical protein
MPKFLPRPAAAPGGVDVNEHSHFEKLSSFNYSTIPPTAVGLELGCGDIGEYPRLMQCWDHSTAHGDV